VPGCTLAEALRRLQGRSPESLTGADLARAVAEVSGREAPAIVEPFAGSWVAACLHVARQIAVALDHAHGRGVVHRDVKPSNIVLTPGGRAMLLDFGLTSQEGADRVTRTGSQVGTLYYMSPEQLQGDRRIDGRTDVYSLGVTLYELLTLQVPYRGEGTL